MAAKVGLLDFRTAFTGQILSTALCALVITRLWIRNRATGQGLWVASFWMQFTALVLILLRGAIPDVVSVIGGNVLLVGGTVLLLIGLSSYVETPWPRIQNYVFLVAFTAVQAYYLFVDASVRSRAIAFSLASMFVAAQIAWLLTKKVAPALRRVTGAVATVFVGYILVGLARIIVDAVSPPVPSLFGSGHTDAILMLAYQLLQVALAFALVMMVTRRLAGALEDDIAQRERDREALALSEQKFSTAFRTSPDAVNINRLSDGLYIDINEGFTRLMGYTADDVVGKTSAELNIWVDPADRERLVAGLLEDGMVLNLEAHFRAKDGSTTTALMSAQVIDVEGERCILSVTRDISDRIAAEDALRKRESDLRKAQHFAHVGSWTWDVGADRLDWSDEMFEIFGEDRQTFTGDPADVMARSIHPDDRALVHESSSSAAKGARPVPIEYRVVRDDGTERVVWAEVGEVVRDEAGNVASMSGTVQDITERRDAEIAIKESEEKFRYIFEYSLVPKSLTRPTGEITVNQAFLDFIGYTRDELAEGSTWQQITHPDDIAPTERIVADMIAGKQSACRFVKRYIRKDGSVVWADVSTSLKRDADGKPEYFVTTLVDITERKKAEDDVLSLNADLEERVRERTAELLAANRELMETNEQLDEATRAKSAFLASMSHELRTPLNSIIGFSELLGLGLAGELMPEQAKQVGMIHASGKHLLSLVDDILDLSKIESGRTAAVIEECDVAGCVGSVLEMIRPLAAAKGLEVEYVCETEAASFRSDPRFVGQILTNLLGNAVKFTDSGTVTLRVTDDPKHLVFSVIDTGRGIEPEDLPHVMERFYQAQSKSEAKSEGAGLGLAISASLAEMIGASIDVESEQGVGSTFTLRVPRNR